MGTTADKLQAVLNSKEAIKTSLENKGMEPTDELSTYAGMIDELENTSDATADASTIMEGAVAYTATGRTVGAFSPTAENITYDNSASGLEATTTQEAIDELVETKYTHPTYTAKSSGLYKVTVDGTGHVSAATAVKKSDITGLGIPAQDTTYNAATTSAAGLMSASDKSKLDNIAAGANAYSHPTYTAKGSGLYKVTVDGTGHVSAASAVAKSDITALGIPAQDTTYGTMGAASSSAAGTSGLVPAPAKGNQAKYLRGDGTWATPTNTTYNAATTSAAGLMSAADKTKLDGIASGANAYSHPAYTAKDSGLYKVTVDATGHVSGTAAVAKSDITALGIPAQDTTYSAATTSAAGLMSSTDKSKLDGIASGANKYSHPTYTAKSAGLYKVTVDGTGHVSAATAVAKSDITALGIPAQDTTYSTMGGATASAAGSAGLVPAPAKGNNDEFLRGDGTWATPTNTTYSAATTSAAGLMSASDKSKLDGITAGANKYTHPGYTAKAAGLYKVTVDATGHVSAATAVAKSDITGLGIPAQDTTYSAMTGASSSAAGKAGLVPAPAAGKQAQFLRGDGTWATPTDTNTDTKVTQTVTTTNASYPLLLAPSGQTATATTTAYFDSGVTLNPSTNTIAANVSGSSGSCTGNAATATKWSTTIALQTKLDKDNYTLIDGSNSENYIGVIGTLPIGNGGTGATTAAAALTNLGLTATAAELNVLDGITATVTELNYMDGVTSNVQTQLNGKAPTSHASSASTYGLGTTANYGHVKTVNGLTTSSHSNGLALSAYQGYVLNNKFANYLPLAGGTMTGNITMSQTGTKCLKFENCGSAAKTVGIVGHDNANSYVWSLYDYTDNESVIRYTGNGDLGISKKIYTTGGLSVGTEKLYLKDSMIQSTVTDRLWIYPSTGNSSYAMFYGNTESGYWTFCPRTSGKLNLGAPSFLWKQLYAQTTTISTSDRNAKEDIADMDQDLAAKFINGIKPSTFKLIDGDSGRTHWGMIAQDIEELMGDLEIDSMQFAGFIKSPKIELYEKEVVNVDDEGKEHVSVEQMERVVEGEYTYGLRYEEFIAPMISTIQKQQKTIEELQKKLASIEAMLAK